MVCHWLALAPLHYWVLTPPLSPTPDTPTLRHSDTLTTILSVSLPLLATGLMEYQGTDQLSMNQAESKYFEVNFLQNRKFVVPAPLRLSSEFKNSSNFICSPYFACLEDCNKTLLALTKSAIKFSQSKSWGKLVKYPRLTLAILPSLLTLTPCERWSPGWFLFMRQDWQAGVCLAAGSCYFITGPDHY